jgi:hypothetical protein
MVTSIPLIRLGTFSCRKYQVVDGGIEVVVFEEDQIGSKGFISHTRVESRRFQGVLAVDWKKYVSWTIFGLQQCSRQVVRVALADFVLGGALELRVLVSRVKTLGLTFGGCTWQ